MSEKRIIYVLANNANVLAVNKVLNSQGFHFEVDRDGLVLHDLHLNQMVDITKLLVKIEESLSAQTCIICEEHYRTQEDFLKGIEGFALSSSRPRGANMQIIYVFAEELPTEVLESAKRRLVAAGVYDFVSPDELKEQNRPFEQALAELIRKPNTRRDVLAYGQLGSIQPSQTAQNSQPSSGPQQSFIAAPTIQTIAVCTTRSGGGSTMLSCALVKTINAAGGHAALITDKPTALELWRAQPSDRRSGRMRRGFRFSGIPVYWDDDNGMAPGLSHVVKDFGEVQPANLPGITAEQKAKTEKVLAQIMTATVRIVVMPFGSPLDWPASRAWLNACRDNLSRWIVCARGATPEFVSNMAARFQADSETTAFVYEPEFSGLFESAYPPTNLQDILSHANIVSAEQVNILSQKGVVVPQTSLKTKKGRD